ncbi:MAG: 50S ribosomal protein L23 [Candidatus Komeilibacteria bacterium]
MSIFDKLKKKEPKSEVLAQSKAEIKAEAPKKAAVVTGRKLTGQTGILLSPVISEKAAHLASVHQYVFHVNLQANKIMVKQAVKAVYKVDPMSVNIVRVQGKHVRRGKTIGQQSDYKKAIVTLKPGQTIELYEGV